MPISDVVEIAQMPFVDLPLLRSPVRDIARSAPSVCATRSGRFDDPNSITFEGREKLAPCFGLVEAALTVSSEVSEHFIAKNENLSRISNRVFEHHAHAGQSGRRGQGRRINELAAPGPEVQAPPNALSSSSSPLHITSEDCETLSVR
jgi:hypothetical protein